MKRATILTAVMLLFIAGTAFAQHGPMMGQHGGKHCGSGMNCGMRSSMGGGHGIGMLMRLGDELALTDQQKADFAKMSEKFGMERIDREAALDKAELKLRTLMMNDAGENEVLKAMDEVGKLKTEMKKMQYQHRQAITAKLTAEQQTKLEELRKDRMDRRGGCDRPCDGPGSGSGKMNDGQGPHGRKG